MSVELGDHQGVSGPAGGERLTTPRPLPVDAGKAVVDVDSLRGLTPERAERIALVGQALGLGEASGVPDEQRARCAPPLSAGPEQGLRSPATAAATSACSTLMGSV